MTPPTPPTLWRRATSFAPSAPAPGPSFARSVWAVARNCAPERLGEPLTATEVEAALRGLVGWRVPEDGRCLARTYSFPSLRAAVAFVALVAEVGEADGYVPEVDLRLLEVTVRIETHVGPGLTALDFQVARSLGGL